MMGRIGQRDEIWHPGVQKNRRKKLLCFIGRLLVGGHLKTLLCLDFRPQQDTGSRTHLVRQLSCPADHEIWKNSHFCIDGESSSLNYLHGVCDLLKLPLLSL